MNCKICTMKDCDCLCDTCLRAKIIFNLPDFVYEMSDYSRRQFIDNQLRIAKGGERES